MFYWLVTTDKTKKNPYGLMGPYNSKFEAQKTADKVDVDVEVLELPTKSIQKATRLVKARISGEEGQFKRTTRQWRHRLSREDGK